MEIGDGDNSRESPDGPVKIELNGQIPEKPDNRRPKRLSAQRAASSVLFWNEERDLKKALQASLVEARKRKQKVVNHVSPVLNNTSGQLNKNNRGSKTQDNPRKNVKKEKDVAESPKTSNSPPVAAPITSAIGVKKCRIPAQRKFAQGQYSSTNNTPFSTPIKLPPTRAQQAQPTTEVFTKHRPHTEDFLTFLCYRGTEFLPPQLDFYALNEVGNDQMSEDGHSDSDSNAGDASSQEKGVRKRSNRQGQNKQKNKARECTGQKALVNESKSDGRKRKPKDSKAIAYENTIKKKFCGTRGSVNASQNVIPATSASKTGNDCKASNAIDVLKEKYKLKRIAKGTASSLGPVKSTKDTPSPNLSVKSSVDQVSAKPTNTARKSEPKSVKETNIKAQREKLKASPTITRRVLRSHHTQSLPHVHNNENANNLTSTPKSPNTTITTTTTSKPYNPVHKSTSTRSRSSSIGQSAAERTTMASKRSSSPPVSCRPHNRKARPSALSLMDYHYEIEGESDHERNGEMAYGENNINHSDQYADHREQSVKRNVNNVANKSTAQRRNRVLRGHEKHNQHETSPASHEVPCSEKKSSSVTNKKSTPNASSSLVGVRPTRKAKPRAFLMDNYETDEESDGSDCTKSKNSTKVTPGTKPQQGDSKDHAHIVRTPSIVNNHNHNHAHLLPTKGSCEKVHVKNRNNNTHKANSENPNAVTQSVEPRVTRSGKQSTPIREFDDDQSVNERSKKIKKQILKIEKRHRDSMKRCPSDSSLHSSNSTSSSESLPSTSSSSSINIPRFTRSLEQLKQLRDKFKEETNPSVPNNTRGRPRKHFPAPKDSGQD